jgi:hypothetical protein
MCAERTIYTWVTVWRRTGSFKQQHGNTTRNRFKLSEMISLVVLATNRLARQCLAQNLERAPSGVLTSNY